MTDTAPPIAANAIQAPAAAGCAALVSESASGAWALSNCRTIVIPLNSLCVEAL
jgi:hypothetical protein